MEADVSIGVDVPHVVNAWDSTRGQQELGWTADRYGRVVEVALTAVTPQPHVFKVTMHVNLTAWRESVPTLIDALNNTCYDIMGRYVASSAYLALALAAVLDHVEDTLQV